MSKLRFHAIDNPVTDPVSVRRARSSSTLNKSPAPKSPSTPKLKLSSKWVPFSQRDSVALEKAYKVITKRWIQTNKKANLLFIES